MALYKSIYYPRMPIGKVWLYHLLLVCFCVCTVTDFSGEDKASGFQFCTVVFGRPGHGIAYFGDLCSPEAKIGRIGHPPGSKVQSGKSFRNCVLFKFARRVYGRPRRRTYSFFFFRLRINFDYALISPPTIKRAASNFARWFTGVHIFVTFAPP